MIVSLWLVPGGVNGVSSKLCPAHFTHVETAIFGFLLFAELYFNIIHQGRSPGNRSGWPLPPLSRLRHWAMSARWSFLEGKPPLPTLIEAPSHHDPKDD